MLNWQMIAPLAAYLTDHAQVKQTSLNGIRPLSHSTLKIIGSFSDALLPELHIHIPPAHDSHMRVLYMTSSLGLVGLIDGTHTTDSRQKLAVMAVCTSP